MSGPAVNNHVWPNKERKIDATKNYVRLVVPGLSSKFWYEFILYIATARLVKHIIMYTSKPIIRAKSKNLVARSTKKKTKTKIKRKITTSLRTTVCEIFQNGWKSSQIISKVQNCLHPHTVLLTQICNVVWKWHQWNTVFTLTSQKTEFARSASEPRGQGLFAEDALAKQKRQDSMANLSSGKYKHPSCNYWHPPSVLDTSLNQDANISTNVDSDTLRFKNRPVNNRRKMVGKDQLLFCESTQMGCVSQDYNWKYILRKVGKSESNQERNHTVKVSKSAWHHIKIRERQSPSRGIV